MFLRCISNVCMMVSIVDEDFKPDEQMSDVAEEYDSSVKSTSEEDSDGQKIPKKPKKEKKKSHKKVHVFSV